jgi:hypothetical protein
MTTTATSNTAISNSFNELLRRIQPLRSELDAAQQHIDVIKTRLRTVFEISDFRIAGSLARGSSIRGFSDADLFAIFRRRNFTRADRLINSDTALSNIRAELIARYPYSSIGKDVMAIAAEFSDGRNVDIVPALFDRMHADKWPIYLIPDGIGGWMETCPSLYDAYIAQANRQSGNKLLYVAQLMKFWRECREPRIPLSSFHIEMVLASEEVCKVARSYSGCMLDILRSLARRECRAIQDPYEIAGNISAVKTASQRDRAFASIIHSRDHASSAVSAESSSSVEARRQWDIVFRGRFPA